MTQSDLIAELVGAGPVLIALWPMYRAIIVQLETIQERIRKLEAADMELASAIGSNTEKIADVEQRLHWMEGETA